MGYAFEKRKRNAKIRFILTVLICLCIPIFCAGAILSAFCPPSAWQYYLNMPKPGKREDGELRIHFLDVGQGDATIVELPDGKTMLIDGGDAASSTENTVLRYLNALEIDTIDYLLVTHADSDHCGSLDKVLEFKTVKRAFVPRTTETVNDEYAEFYAALLKEGCEIAYSQNGIQLGATESETPYRLSFLSPSAYGEEKTEEAESNATSAVVWLDYNGVSTLFTGDAPKEVEERLVRSDRLGLLDNLGVELDSTEILKVAHHGSADSTSSDFLSYLHVRTAVISCGENNVYGHPTAEVLVALTANGTDVYRTDLQGGVIVSVSKGSGKWSVQTYGKA
ncbi:MAG: MBL fold metallo-hydrolase [Clostridia bacterium]|nr:MBL fold metallo-hydrolase [Clostridia bacterium]